MNVNNITKYAVGLVIGLVMVAGLIVPIVDAATETEKTFTNSGLFYMTDIQPYSFTYYAETNNIVVNGEEMGRPEVSTDSSYIVTEVFLLRASAGTVRLISPDSASSTNYNLQVSVEDNIATVIRGGTADAEGVITGGTTYSYPIEVFYGVAPEGEYVMSNGSVKVVDETQIIYGAGATQISNWLDSFFVKGSVKDGAEVEVLHGNFTLSNIKLNYSKINGYKGYEVDGISFTATNDSTSKDCNYSRVVVPASITIEKEYNPTYNVLFNIIPLLGITVLIVSSAMFIKNKRA